MATQLSHSLPICDHKPAKYDGKTVTAPVKSGSFSEVPPGAKINTAGGFTISHKGTTISVTGLKSTSNGTSGSGTDGDL